MMNRTINSRVFQTLVAVSVVLGFGIATSVFAETVYIWRDNGVRHFSDICPPGEKCRAKDIGSMGERRQEKWRARIEASTSSGGTTDTSTSPDSGATSDGSTGDTTSTGGTTTTAGDSTSEPTTGQSEDTTSAGDTTTDTDTPTDNTATLEWDPVNQPEVAGYRIYHAVAGGSYPPFGSGINAGSSNSITISRLDSGNRYYFRVTAVDNAGNESGFSNEVYKDFP